VSQEVSRPPAGDDVKKLEAFQKTYESLRSEIAKVIIGQERVIDELLIALFAGGHALLVGVPGLAKTLMISTVARILDLEFSRIQFTPDLMPSDITGTEILEEDAVSKKRIFRFFKGPIFANVILADEINRTPPKTQSALLQAMQEKQVTAAGATYDLELPFFVLATQNPIEMEGTYPLPEAQLDRFMLNVLVDYPDNEQEQEIVESTTSSHEAVPSTIMSASDIVEVQSLVRRVPMSRPVLDYAVRLVRATRPVENGTAPGRVRELVSWGAGPRAAQHLVLASKVQAMLDGRPTPSREDVRAVVPPVLRHRIVSNYNAEAEGISTDRIIQFLLEEIPE
jgi:MoxR-like ATPase